MGARFDTSEIIRLIESMEHAKPEPYIEDTFIILRKINEYLVKNKDHVNTELASYPIEDQMSYRPSWASEDISSNSTQDIKSQKDSIENKSTKLGHNTTNNLSSVKGSSNTNQNSQNKRVEGKSQSNKRNESIFTPRMITQQYMSRQAKKDPVVTISTDAGILQTPGYTERYAQLNTSLILISNEKSQVGLTSQTLQPKGQSEQMLLMGITELIPLICAIRRIRGVTPYCEEVDPSNYQINLLECPCKEIDWSVYDENVRIFVSTDRPLIPYYLTVIQSDTALLLIRTYQKLFETLTTFDATAYTFIAASMQKNVLDSIIDILNHGEFISPSHPLSLALLNWIKEYPEELKQIIEDVDLSISSDFNDLIDQLEDNTNRVVMIGAVEGIENLLSNTRLSLQDYKLFTESLDYFEERSAAWEINLDYRTNSNYDPYRVLDNHFHDTEFRFFYLNYLESWARVEFINGNPQEVYEHCLWMTSYSKSFYPVHLGIAHNVAVINGEMRKTIINLMSRILGSKPGRKLLSKYGSVGI